MFNMNHAVFQCNCTQIILVFQSFFSSKSVMLVFCHQYLLKEAPKQRPKGHLPVSSCFIHSPRLTRMITIFNHRNSPCCKKYRRPGVSTIASTAYSPHAGRGVHGETTCVIDFVWNWKLCDGGFLDRSWYLVMPSQFHDDSSMLIIIVHGSTSFMGMREKKVANLTVSQRPHPHIIHIHVSRRNCILSEISTWGVKKLTRFVRRQHATDSSLSLKFWYVLLSDSSPPPKIRMSLQESSKHDPFSFLQTTNGWNMLNLLAKKTSSPSFQLAWREAPAVFRPLLPWHFYGGRGRAVPALGSPCQRLAFPRSPDQRWSASVESNANLNCLLVRFHHLEKYESQLGRMTPHKWKKQMFETSKQKTLMIEIPILAFKTRPAPYGSPYLLPCRKRSAARTFYLMWNKRSPKLSSNRSGVNLPKVTLLQSVQRAWLSASARSDGLQLRC